jgi:hypothetical protein
LLLQQALPVLVQQQVPQKQEGKQTGHLPAKQRQEVE